MFLSFISTVKTSACKKLLYKAETPYRRNTALNIKMYIMIYRAVNLADICYAITFYQLWNCEIDRTKGDS